ncbi:MAG: adenine deaminase [Geminicoccaceae bacterium]
MTDAATLARRIDQAMGREPADLVIRNARLLDVATGTLRDAADIAVCGDTVVGILGSWQGRREIDAQGRIATPGLIDTHLHVESSMVTPAEFEKGVLPRGTTTAVCDPHEIANVTGLAGIRYFLEAATSLAMTLRVNLSSCVPATELETSGARLEAADLVPLLAHPAALGLAEVMNYPGVLANDPGMLAKLEAFARYHKDGHSPLLQGAPLDAYLSTGIATDHECTRPDEAAEKLAKGMAVLIREGSVAKNVEALAPLVTERTWMRTAFCTDDRNPLEIVEDGHIDYALRKAIRHGAELIPAWRAATLGAATIFGLTDRGLVAPGRRADILLVDDLAEVAVSSVICAGRPVEPSLFEGRRHPEPVGYGSVKRAPVTADLFRTPGSGPTTPVIGVIPHSIITEHLTAELPFRDGLRHADPDRSLHKLAVLERHGVNGNVGRGFVHGFGPMRGAIATSIGHDCHNLIVVGDDDADMALAVNRLIELQGGVAVVRRGEVLGDLALPVAGLMSDRGFTHVRDRLVPLRAAAAAIGCALDEPTLQLAFLPLPVIPHLKLTDRGLVAADGTGLAFIAA